MNWSISFAETAYFIIKLCFIFIYQNLYRETLLCKPSITEQSVVGQNTWHGKYYVHGEVYQLTIHLIFLVSRGMVLASLFPGPLKYRDLPSLSVPQPVPIWPPVILYHNGLSFPSNLSNISLWLGTTDTQVPCVASEKRNTQERGFVKIMRHWKVHSVHGQKKHCHRCQGKETTSKFESPNHLSEIQPSLLTSKTLFCSYNFKFLNRETSGTTRFHDSCYSEDLCKLRNRFCPQQNWFICSLYQWINKGS